MAKYFIFKSKLEKLSPNFNAFKHYLKERKEIEKHIALMKNKLHIHNQKWNQLIL